MDTEQALTELIDMIYAAAVDPEQWPRTLERLRTLVPANTAHFAAVDPAAGSGFAIATGDITQKDIDD